MLHQTRPRPEMADMVGAKSHTDTHTHKGNARLDEHVTPNIVQTPLLEQTLRAYLCNTRFYLYFLMFFLKKTSKNLYN